MGERGERKMTENQLALRVAFAYLSLSGNIGSRFQACMCSS
jgi:hypothetical protein